MLAVLNLAACHYDFDESTIDQSGVGGVARLDDGGFAFAIYPCTDDRVSRLELVVQGLVDLKPVLHTTVLRAQFDPPASARELLISTSPDFVPAAGTTVEVLDPVALDRFNSDESYLTSWDLDEYFSINAWDRAGESLQSGSYLWNRFDARPGQLELTDAYVNDIDKVRCHGEKNPAWHLPTNS